MAYNCGLTVVVNSFGPALVVLQHELAATRAGVSLAFGFLMLSMGVLAPVVGILTQRLKLRTLMMAGAAMHSIGFLLLAFARTLTEVLVLYGFVIGPAVCLMALITAPTLISRWFERDRGKALGLGLVQVFALFTAPLAAWLISLGGRSLLFVTLAGLFAVLVPMAGLVIDRPEAVGQLPRRAHTGEKRSSSSELPHATSRDILTDRRFWLLNLAIGICTFTGVILASHGPAMAVAKGVTSTLASTVLSASGGGALIGALAFGWLIDRFGPFRALICDLALISLAWLIFSRVSSWPLMMALGFTLGGCIGPTVALQSACITEIFGTANFGRVMGYSYFVKTPFLFGAAPLAGHLYDLSGTYGLTYLVLVSGTAVALILAILLTFNHHRHSALIGRPGDTQCAR
ncbi:MAG: MFS transporter [Steroidobacteraceae bacterium]